MFFIDSSDIKFVTFNYIFHNMITEIGLKKYQQNCGKSFREGGSNNYNYFITNHSIVRDSRTHFIHNPLLAFTRNMLEVNEV